MRSGSWSTALGAFWLAALVAGGASAVRAIEATPDAPAPVAGFWLTENGRAIVEFRACKADPGGSGDLCGRLAWIADPHDETGALKRDAKNRIAALKSRPICGLELVGGLADTGEGGLSDGWLYNPRSGKVYSANVEAVSATELRVHGYLMVPLLGQSQIWTRVDDARTGCPADGG